jgi:hypothetical protein
LPWTAQNTSVMKNEKLERNATTVATLRVFSRLFFSVVCNMELFTLERVVPTDGRVQALRHAPVRWRRTVDQVQEVPRVRARADHPG